MAAGAAARMSLRSRLLLGILAPVLVFTALGAASLYRQALRAADTAYDRTLLASAKAIGELLQLRGDGQGAPTLQSTLVYSALEAFEADNRSRLFYKVSGFEGEMISGFADLGAPQPAAPGPGPYAALVHFYDDRYRGEPVRMAVLKQPVAGPGGQGMATVQVAETLELRRSLARQLLLQTLWQQALLLLLIAAAVVAVVQRATAPLRELSRHLRDRDEADLSPLPGADAPRELQPVVTAVNALLGRTARLVEHQKRFVRDASHQLRTPLAVLKAQVQSARRGDVAPALALQEIEATVDGASTLAGQMLALAKVEQLRQQGEPPVLDWAAQVRTVALDLSALIAEAGLDFELATEPAPVRGHDWALRELVRNLLHNAVRHSPRGGRLSVTLTRQPGWARLVIADSGPGIAPAQREHLFQPFASSQPDTRGQAGSGLGLAICHEIVKALGGRLGLEGREDEGRPTGLDATVQLPLVEPP